MRILFFIFFISTVALAETRLTPWDELSQVEQARLASARKASFALDFKGSNCSGTYISSEGHILTAAHCVESCIYDALMEKGFDMYADSEKNLVYHVDTGPEGIKSYPLAEYRQLLISTDTNDDDLKYIQTKHYNTEIFKGLKCNARIDGEEVELSYVGGGVGELFPFLYKEKYIQTPALKSLWKKFNSMGLGSGGDFSVLKVKKTNTACLEFSSNDPRPSEKLEALSSTLRDGYRYEDERLGQTIFHTVGMEETNELHKYRPDLDYPFIHAYLYGDYGSSGSSAFGEDGTVKGVLVQSLGVAKDGKYSFTFSTMITASHIRATLKNIWDVSIPKCNTTKE